MHYQHMSKALKVCLAKQQCIQRRNQFSVTLQGYSVGVGVFGVTVGGAVGGMIGSWLFSGS